MNLTDLLAQHQTTPANSVPDWVIGAFKRRSISFANGLTDIQTHVFWLQSRNLTVDLRLPIDAEQVTEKVLQDFSTDDIRALANYEGWSADSVWLNDQLSWSGGTSLQLHNRWPEPAELKRIGDCMVEFAPSGAYVEDWRLLSRSSGPLLGLKLLEETDATTGEVRHRDGALIINGDWAGLVLGRPTPLTSDTPQPLRELLDSNGSDDLLQQAIFQFETSIAQGNLDDGFRIKYSTLPQRVNQTLFQLDGFEVDSDNKTVLHRFHDKDREIIRRFSIDTIENHFGFSPMTRQTSPSKDWFDREQETLNRYLCPVQT
ncbi:MAG: hypothetical protein AseanaTS_07120 [Candidatus Pelagadaptatus aseana]|uniref:hypothetical protein n=1 Tax=Candidatus Pelagadaptatus aseana TaxID=3120508 RepID=UPI0039B2AD59